MVPLITHSLARDTGPAEPTSDPLANVRTLAECLDQWRQQRVLMESDVQITPVESITTVKAFCTTLKEPSAC